MNSKRTYLGIVDETHDPLVYGHPHHRNEDERRPVPAIDFFVELGMEETEAFSWHDTLSQPIPSDLSEDDLVEHQTRIFETRKMFTDRVGLNPLAALYVHSPAMLAQRAKAFREEGFTCAATILHLINAHATPALALSVHQAGASRGDTPHVIEAARQVMLPPPLIGRVTALNVVPMQNIVLDAWFTSGIPARWVPRYLAAGLSLHAALTTYEPERLEDEQRVLDALHMLVALRRPLLAA
jgi:hypothetical protein